MSSRDKDVASSDGRAKRDDLSVRENPPQQNPWHARRVAVLGAGRSGRAAAALLHAQGARVTVLDDATPPEARTRLARLGGLPQGVHFHGGGIRLQLLREAEWIVRSPGIPLRHPACVWAQAQGMPIVTEIDVACAYLPDCAFIGVTGTNGKSTVTCMLGGIFKSFLLSFPRRRESTVEVAESRDAIHRVSKRVDTSGTIDAQGQSGVKPPQSKAVGAASLCHPDERSEEGSPRVSPLPLVIPAKAGISPCFETRGDPSPVLHHCSGQARDDKKDVQESKATQWLFVGGNLGTPLCEAVLAGLRPAWAVLELSSFQLQSLRDLRLAAAIVTNIGVDHTREHGSHENYVRAKARIVELLRPGGVLVCRSRDLELLPSASLRARGGTVWCVENCPVPPPPSIAWEHDRANAATAACAATALGIAPSVIADGLAAYRGLPHRFEQLGELRGVRFINDSKATNVAATVAALHSVGQGRVHLILGGQGKGESYAPLREACGKGRVTVYAVGDEAAAIKRCLAQAPAIPCVFAGTLARAVDLAWQGAAPGETILLAPACPSFDQFANFAARGEVFRSLFKRLRDGDPNFSKNDPFCHPDERSEEGSPRVASGWGDPSPVLRDHSGRTQDDRGVDTREKR